LNHILRCGDCLRELPLLEAGSVDVVVTSPPYNLGLGYRSYDDRLGEDAYLTWLMAVAEAVKRVMRPDGSFFLNISGSSKSPWLPFELIVRLRQIFVLQNHITWIKSITTGDDTVGHFKPVAGGRFLHQAHEHIFHLTLTGDVKLDRLAIGVPYKDKSNITRTSPTSPGAAMRRICVAGATPGSSPTTRCRPRPRNSVLCSTRHHGESAYRLAPTHLSGGRNAMNRTIQGSNPHPRVDARLGVRVGCGVWMKPRITYLRRRASPLVSGWSAFQQSGLR
jgi:hypothetical protein